MVKADAYGLGMSSTVAALEPVRPWGMGVATVSEGAALRGSGYADPILVFSPVPPTDFDRVANHALTPCLSDLASVDLLERAARRVGKRLDYHIEVDTGMGRSGFDWRDVTTWGPRFGNPEHSARPTGLFTHFHSADVDADATAEQWRRLGDVLAAVPISRESLIVHAANSAGALRLPDVAADAVRPGIYLYGGAAGPELPPPEAVAALRVRVILVRDVPSGTTLGYGATHAADGPRRWATLGVGYGDGLPRSLGNRGRALIGGRPVPIIGRISMDMTVVDITDLEHVEVGDVATLVGSDGAETITLEEVADLAGTINYEILTGFSQRLPRVWMDDGRS